MASDRCAHGAKAGECAWPLSFCAHGIAGDRWLCDRGPAVRLTRHPRILAGGSLAIEWGEEPTEPREAAEGAVAA